MIPLHAAAVVARVPGGEIYRLPPTGADWGIVPHYGELVGNTPQAGQIDASSNQVIENKVISNPNGIGIYIGPNVTNVTIRNCIIGPCGSNVSGPGSGRGIFMVGNNTTGRIIIQNNVFTDTMTAVSWYGTDNWTASRCIWVLGNRFLNQRISYLTSPVGDTTPPYVYQWIEGVSISLSRGKGYTASGGVSRVEGNIIDSWEGVGYGNVSSRPTFNNPDMLAENGLHRAYALPLARGGTDQISMFEIVGAPTSYIRVAFNRIRGGGWSNGSGIMLCDAQNPNAPSGYIRAFNNRLYMCPNSAIQIAAGIDNIVERNYVDSRGKDRASLTHMAISARNYRNYPQNQGHLIKDNRTFSRLWDHSNTTSPFHGGVDVEAGINGVTLQNNTQSDATLGEWIISAPWDTNYS